MASSVFMSFNGLTTDGSGNVSYPAGVTAGGTVTGVNVQAGSTGLIFWTNRTWMGASGDGLFEMTKSGATNGVGLDVVTNNVLKVRTLAQSAYATVDALGYSVGGVAGASKTAGPVTSITVVNGVVTACT